MNLMTCMSSIKKILVGYFIFFGVIAHFAIIGILILFPNIRYSLQNKAYAVFEKLDNQPNQYNLTEEISMAFGAWKPLEYPAQSSQRIMINGREYPSLDAASAALQPGDTLELGPGKYKRPLIIQPNNITLLGKGRVIFDGAIAEGKGAIVVKGNNFTIKNIECTGIKAPDQNGACVRLEGQNITLDHVYFHNSEEGLLTGNQPENVLIKDSRFELLGRSGQAHGIYIGQGKLRVEDSLFIASVDEGHEIKSRAKVTEIVRTIVASLSANDSRLIDVPNGGVLSIQDSILEKGPLSSNADLIGYGLEGIKHGSNSLELRNNLIIMERKGPNNLTHLKSDSTASFFSGNVTISKTDPNLDGLNLWYENREKSGLDKYPYIPTIANTQLLK